MTKVSRNAFEKLVLQMLADQGFDVSASSKAADVGVDAIAIDEKHGRRWAVQMKYHGGRQVPASSVMKSAWDLRAAREYVGADEALLVIDGRATPFARELAAKAGVSLVDGPALNTFIAALNEKKQASQKEQTSTATKPQQAPTEAAEENHNASHDEKERHEHLREQLAAIPCGRDAFRQFEDVGVEILNFLFRPPLGVPRIQTVSDDGLDRRDAVYKIGYGNEIWDAVKSECRTRFLVAEFKNGCNEPDQRDVESLEQYLWGEGLRTFGLLCTRRSPSASALAARRRAWTKSRVLIVILDETDLTDMLAIKGAREDPAILLDKKIDDFFSTVSA